jgi:hypothetical protein
MKKYLLSFSVIFVITVAYAQVPSHNKYANTKYDSLYLAYPLVFVSIYEYGKPVKSCEDNFKNLFDNWVPEVVNAPASTAKTAPADKRFYRSGFHYSNSFGTNSDMYSTIFRERGETIKLLSWKYIETIKTKKQVNKYIDRYAIK